MPGLLAQAKIKLEQESIRFLLCFSYDINIAYHMINVNSKSLLRFFLSPRQGSEP